MIPIKNFLRINEGLWQYLLWSFPYNISFLQESNYLVLENRKVGNYFSFKEKILIIEQNLFVLGGDSASDMNFQINDKIIENGTNWLIIIVTINLLRMQNSGGLFVNP